MTISIWIPLLGVIIGLLVYVLGAKPETKEIGRLLYGASVLVTMFELATRVLTL